MDYFQDTIEGNHCFGCGPLNTGGLAIKSRWENETESICLFNPQPQHCAAPTKFLNGGIIATIMDCHCICTAIAYAYRKAGRVIGDGEQIWYVTSSLKVDYQRPVFITQPAILRAHVTNETEKSLELACTLISGEKPCVTCSVVASRGPLQWMVGQE